MSAKQQQRETCIVTYEMSQDNLGPRFRCGWTCK